jgi:ribosomal protein L7/L12
LPGSVGSIDNKAVLPVAKKPDKEPAAIEAVDGEAPKKSKKKLVILIGIIVMLLAVLGAGGFFGYKWWMGRPAAAGAGEAEKKEEKSTFDVILQDAGANKIQVIKVIRAITNLGLKEAKTLTDTPPQPVKTGVPKEEAEKILKELAAAGAKVELK